MKYTMTVFITMIFLCPAFFSMNYAILSGINNYEYLYDLKYTEKDVCELEETLHNNGFSVISLKGEQVTLAEMLKVIRNLVNDSTENDKLLFFFSGHGCSGINETKKGLLLHDSLPDDTNDFLSQERLKNELLPFKGKTMVVIDACYQGNAEKAFTRKQFSDESFYNSFDFLLTSSGANQSSHDGFYRGNVKVENGVAAYYLIKAVEGEADSNRDNCLSAKELNNYFNQHAQFMAQNNGQDMEIYFRSEDEKLLTLNATKAIQLASQQEVTENNKNMIHVQGDKFLMGNYDFHTDFFISPDELPSHYVILTYDFLMSRYEITFEEYDQFCQSTGKELPDDGGFGRKKRPVSNVSWEDATAYCNWLSLREGLPPAYDHEGNLLDPFGSITTDITEVKGYRLPTEAEWEYAAKGGTSNSMTAFSGSGDIDAVAWHYENGKIVDFPDCSQFPHSQSVGLKQPNELGLYDMTGNVYEWCHDAYERFWYKKNTVINPINTSSSEKKILRGGSSFTFSYAMDNAERHCSDRNGKYNDVGFRIARTDTIHPNAADITLPQWPKNSVKLISSPEKADIVINGKRHTEQTPCNLELLEGFYEINVEKADYNQHSEKFYLKMGTDKTIDVTLIPSGQNKAKKANHPEEVFVTGGSFVMGDHCGDAWQECQPHFEVTLTYDFWIGKYETTNDNILTYLNNIRLADQLDYDFLYEIGYYTGEDCVFSFDRDNFPYINNSGEDHAVSNLSIRAVVKYCNWLSDMNGLKRAYDEAGNLIDRFGKKTDSVLKVEGYRLPTEAEWEFAARGGVESRGFRFPGSNSANEVGWYCGNSGDHGLNGTYNKLSILTNNCRIHSVGEKKPNELGLYDMSGNVREMCQDAYTLYNTQPKVNRYVRTIFENYPMRGGSYTQEMPHLRIPHRFGTYFYGSDNELGFRIARTAIK